VYSRKRGCLRYIIENIKGDNKDNDDYDDDNNMYKLISKWFVKCGLN
jgi:hypothetical protein